MDAACNYTDIPSRHKTLLRIGLFLHQKSTSSFTFSLSPFTIASFFSSNCSMSHVTLTYRPASQSRFTAVSHTTVSAGSSGVSVKTCMSSSGTSPLVAISVRMLPGWMEMAVTPREPYSLSMNCVKRTTASLDGWYADREGVVRWAPTLLKC